MKQSATATPTEPAKPASAAQPRVRTVAVGGLVAIGRKVSARLDEGIPGLRLVAVSARNIERAESIVAKFGTKVPAVPLSKLGGLADIVVECAPAEVFMEVAEPALRAGRILVVISVGALVEQPGLAKLAEEYGGRIIVATGALLGLDAVQAARKGEIHSVTMITRKPPGGLMGAPYLVKNGIDVSALTAPLKVFEGSARDVVRGFPANVNVAPALGLAGIGLDRTTIEIWADPSIERNMHTIKVDAHSASFTLSIANIPSENPKTGRITALSIIAALRKLGSPISAGPEGPLRRGVSCRGAANDRPEPAELESRTLLSCHWPPERLCGHADCAAAHRLNLRNPKIDFLPGPPRCHGPRPAHLAARSQCWLPHPPWWQDNQGGSEHSRSKQVVRRSGIG